MTPFSEKSEIKLDLKTLIGLIIGIVSIAGIWFSLTASIRLIEMDLSRVKEKSNSNYIWINDFQPPKVVQETIEELRKMKIENAVLKYRVEQLEKIKIQK
tara:strand:+ start:94 stop:393 length:300 start_codon:yes stop_codon:yes gene_type:complete